MANGNVHFQPNPNKNSKIGDCVVRAMCKATGKEWDDVFVELCTIGLKLKAMPNDKPVWEEFMNQNGFIKHKISNKKGSKRPTVKSFAKSNKKGTYVLQVANHLVTSQDGKYFDTWDCGDKSLYSYYEKV